jgi:hypothetical protein
MLETVHPERATGRRDATMVAIQSEGEYDMDEEREC